MTKNALLYLLLIPAAAAPITGCDQLQTQSQTATAPKVKKEAERPTHRFAMEKFDGGVAFDTQTGQICRTWDWQPTGKRATLDPVTGGAPQRSFGEFAPTCLSLYQQYPSSGPGPNVISEEAPAN